MIRTLTFRSRLDGKDGVAVSEAIRAMIAKRIRTDNTVRGVRIVVDGDVIDINLRMSGVDRWRISRHARKVASYLLASQKLPFTKPLYPVQEVTEPSARTLTLEQGRTPQSVTGGRPAGRTGLSDVPRPWWGDELPQ